MTGWPSSRFLIIVTGRGWVHSRSVLIAYFASSARTGCRLDLNWSTRSYSHQHLLDVALSNSVCWSLRVTWWWSSQLLQKMQVLQTNCYRTLLPDSSRYVVIRHKADNPYLQLDACWTKASEASCALRVVHLHWWWGHYPHNISNDPVSTFKAKQTKQSKDV